MRNKQNRFRRYSLLAGFFVGVLALVVILMTSLPRTVRAAGPTATPTSSGIVRKIVFVSKRDGNEEIYVMDTDGSNERNLTNNKAYDGGPVWSPDGKHIAFLSERDGNEEIYVMDADGANQRNVSNNKADDFQPAWQP